MPADMDEGYPVESNRTVGSNEMGGLPYDNEHSHSQQSAGRKGKYFPAAATISRLIFVPHMLCLMRL